MIGPHTAQHAQLSRLSLTPREHEILDFILAGASNKLTAYNLGISQRTVEVHRSRIFQKLGVRNALELIAGVYSHAIDLRPFRPGLSALAEADAPGHPGYHGSKPLSGFGAGSGFTKPGGS